MIRKLKEKDVDNVMKIWLESSIIAHDFIDKEYWIDNYELVKNKYIPNSECFVYEEDNKINGFISIINKEFIGALFVENESQGKGFGSKLIEYVKKEYGRLTLMVYKDNLKSVEFYKNKGFNIISEDLDEDTNKVEFIMKCN